MRNQDMMKHKEQEIRELKSRVPEVVLLNLIVFQSLLNHEKLET